MGWQENENCRVSNRGEGRGEGKKKEERGGRDFTRPPYVGCTIKVITDDILEMVEDRDPVITDPYRSGIQSVE